MSIEATKSVSPDFRNNYQIQQLEKKIQDWRTCPTTDPQTKQQKVQELQVKEEAVKASLTEQAAAPNPTASEDAAEATGTGRSVDLYA